MKRAVLSRSGSAPGFSQPLSGFLARPSFAALFRAATVPGILPLELSLRKDRAPLSRPLCSPDVIHQRAEPYCPSALLPPVSPTPTLLTQLPGFLKRLWTPFSRTRRPASQLPWTPRSRIDSFCQLHRTSKLLSPHKSVRTSPSCPDLAADTLLSFLFLSRVFSVHASRSQTRPGLADLNPSQTSGDVGPATLETSSLKCRVKPT